MTTIDWIVLGLSQLFIVVYGIYKSRGKQSLDDYYKGGSSMNWFTVGLSIMATQASAITFLSAPGQAYEEGMGFVQFYFGLPLAMVVLSITAVPLYHKMNVTTAYEFLEKRFDIKTRLVAAILFLTQRGLAAGFTIFAPSLVLSSILGWNINLTTIIIGLIVVIYTVSGGTKAVSATQKTQMAIILFGMLFAAWWMVRLLPGNMGLGDALHIAGSMEKLNVIDTTFDLKNKYNIWSGMIGGFFLALSYFGTDQSQVGRYLTASSITQSRMGLLFNGIFKIPMQFGILMIGAILYVFYLFYTPPIFFNKVLVEQTTASEYAPQWNVLQQKNDSIARLKTISTKEITDLLHEKNKAEYSTKVEELKVLDAASKKLRKEAKKVIQQANPTADSNDTNYIFFSFVNDFLPIGLLGLIISVIFSASMSSTSSELNALASTTTVDIYKRIFNQTASDASYVRFSKLCTVFWGLYAIVFALFANRLGTLIEAVNILGSLVYGTILGIFLTAFYFKKIGSNAVFIAALITEAIILCLWWFDIMPFLWLNLVGALAVIFLSMIFQSISPEKSKSKA